MRFISMQPQPNTQTERGGREGAGRGWETASNTNTKAAKGIQIAIIYHVEIAASHTPPRRGETRLDSSASSGAA